MDETRASDGGGGEPLAPVLAGFRAAVAGLGSDDLAGIDSAALLGETATLRALADRVEGEWLRRLGEVHARGAAVACGAPTTKAWARGTLLLSPTDASRAVQAATSLRSMCTATADALAAGTIGVGQAVAITRAIDKLPSALPAERREQGEALLIQHARVLDPAQVALAGRHLGHTLDPEGVYRDERAAVDRSGITFASTLDGAGIVRGDLDPETLALIQAAIEPLAAPAPAINGVLDQRSAARRRLDGLRIIIRHWRDCPHTDRPAGTRTPAAHVTITMPAETLTGQPGAPAAQLSWGGAISGVTARKLSCDAAITRVLLSPLGQPLDVGRTTRTIPPAIWTALVTRDTCCAFPGCDQPPSRCQAHHLWHWADGGPTALSNLVLVCDHHHDVLHDQHHHDHWTVRIDTDTGLPAFTPPAWTRRRGIPLPPLAHLAHPPPWPPPDDG